jgi:hypothetical protein
MSPPSPPLPIMRRLACVRCGAAFDCGAGMGACWCAAEDFRMPMPPADAGEDCLCPACLRKLAQSSNVINREGSSFNSPSDLTAEDSGEG